MALEQNQNTEGTANAVSSNTFDVKAQTLDPDPGVQPANTDDEMAGGLGDPPGPGAAGYEPSANMSLRPRPGNLGVLMTLASQVSAVHTAGNGVITDPDGATIPTNAHRFVWTVGGTTPATVLAKTAKVLTAPPSGKFYQLSGFGIDSLELKPDGSVWGAAIAYKALYWALIADPTLVLAYETPPPFYEGMMTLSWLANSASTKEFTTKIDNGLAFGHDFSVASLFYNILERSAHPQFGGTIVKRSLESVDWNAFIGGTTFAAKIKFLNTVAATGAYKHALWLQFPCCMYKAGKPDEISNLPAHGASFDYKAMLDPTTNTIATITLVNATTAYETYA
jgi:hypothetical protein